MFIEKRAFYTITCSKCGYYDDLLEDELIEAECSDAYIYYRDEMGWTGNGKINICPNCQEEDND